MSPDLPADEPGAKEMTLVRALGNELSPPGTPAPAAVTARVLNSLSGATRSRRPPVVSRRWLPRRPALWLVPAAAATVAGVVLSGVVPGLPGEQPRPGTPTVTLNSRSILLAAATRARSLQQPIPGPGQYVYSRVLEEIDQINTDRTTVSNQETLDVWLPVDGRRNGWIHGVENVTRENSGPPQKDTEYPTGLIDAYDPCPGPAAPELTDAPESYCPGPGYVADFPNDPGDALTFLKQGRRWNGWTPFSDRPGDTVEDHAVIGNLIQLYRTHQLPPGGWAAVYDALAGLPRATVVEDVKTAGGRTGVAVVMEFAVFEREYDSFKGRYEFVFDPTTYDLIGINDIEEGDTQSTPLIVTRTEVLRSAVVKTPGLYPDGTKVTKVVGRPT